MRRRSVNDAAEVAVLALEVSSELFSRALRLAGDWAEADDLVQEAFTAVLTDWGRVRGYPRDQQLAWLNRVMINKQVDRWRVGRRHASPVAEVPDIRAAASAESIALDREALRRCDEVIKSMPPERRKAAFLRWYCGWSAAEIAEWNGVAAPTVRVHLMLALKQLNEEVRPHVPFIDDVDDQNAGKREEAQ
jgi:RNA polymerase sigma-70 factor (ECF subfamily)